MEKLAVPTEPGPKPKPPPVHTARWTAAIARGDEAAFGSFYEAWFDRTFALARSISRRDEAFCMDVVQDAMMRVIRSMPPLETEAAVESWMGRTVLTTTIDQLRSEKRRRARERNAAPDESISPTQHTELEDEERLDWLRAKIAALPERDRRLLAERFAGDRTLAEVGAALGISGNAAHGRIRRVLDSIRDAAARWFDD